MKIVSRLSGFVPVVPVSAAVIALATLAIGTVPSAATEIGTVSAANQRIDGTPPGGNQRVLQLGNQIFADELIVSSEIGSGQFVFLDQTTLTVSPGSEILLDRYIFDPESGSGEMALTLTKGVLRFIGGKVTKTGEATISTPHATIGIRGGIAAITVGEEGTNAVFLAGTNMCVAGKSQSVCVSRPGGMVSVKSPAKESSGGQSGGQSGSQSGGSSAAAGESEGSGEGSGEPVYQGVATAEQIGLVYSASNTGGNGGTTQPMETEVVASTSTSSGMTQVGAESPGAPQQPPVSTKGEEQQSPQQSSGGSESGSTSDPRSEPETSSTSSPPADIVDGFMGGVKSDISTLGTSGSASFVGTATASVLEIDEVGTLSSQQDGSYVMIYDFGDRAGSATISGIADTIFVATITEANAAPGEHFGGAMRDTDTFTEVGTLNGSFFTNLGDTSAATAGTFDFARQLDGGVSQSGTGEFQADKLNLQ